MILECHRALPPFVVAMEDRRYTVSEDYSLMMMMMMMTEPGHLFTGVPKSSSLNNFANFSRTIKSYEIKFYTLVTH